MEGYWGMGPAQGGGRGSGGRRGGGGGRGRGGGRGGRGGGGRWQGGPRGSTRGGRYQGGSRRTDGVDSRPDVRFGFHSLKSMLEKDPDELVLDMTSERCMAATEALLEQVEMRDDLVVLVFKVLARACECGTTLSGLQKLLSVLPRSIYLNHHLSSYINRLPSSSRQADGYELEVELKAIVKLLTEVLRRLPSSFADLPVPQLSFATNALVDCARITNSEIQASVGELLKLKDEMAEKVKKQDENTRRPRRRNAGEAAALMDDEAPPDDFRQLSVTPEIQDVHVEGPIFLRRNKIDGSYNDPEHYLDVQFRLLREDFVRPLREGIHKMLERMGSAKMGPLQDIRIYHGVKILFPMFTSKGLTHKISIDVSKLKRVRWENSKRLIFGSLLCLSKDKFETFVLATVENRDLKELREGRVEVRFTDLSQKIDLDKTEYQMVETTAYFEACRHVLEGLKEVQPERLPFQVFPVTCKILCRRDKIGFHDNDMCHVECHGNSLIDKRMTRGLKYENITPKRYIVSCEKNVEAPAYLRNRMRGVVTYDLTPIMKKEALNRTTNARPASSYRGLLRDFNSLSLNRSNRGDAVRILDMNSWPSAEDLELDSSQLKAVQLALTKEFAIIQGPPGTGKTYIGLKVVKVLLHNRQMWNKGSERFIDDDEELRGGVSSSRPILVVCYTNHALDQFLEGIHEFHPEGIVRVGGRSQSEKMQACSLSELKHIMHKDKKAPREIRRAFYEVHEQLEHVSQQMKSATENLQKCMENVVHEDQIRREGHMTEQHYDSMLRPIKDRITGMITVKSAMCHWLGLTLNTSDAFETSAFVNPIALFPFNNQTKKVNALNPTHKAILKNVSPAPGLDGTRGGSYELQGARDSYIIIPNMENNLLDTRHSMTIVMFVYPMSPDGGPIVTFHDQGAIGIQIGQNGVDQNGKGVLFASFNRRDGATPRPLSKAVLKLNEWNYIAASYDILSGFSRLWHNGKMVQEQQNENMEIASHLPVYIGSLNLPDHNSFFEGRISSLQFYPEAIGREQVMAIAGIREEDIEEEENEEASEEAEDKDVLYEAGAMEGQRILDVDEVERFGNRGRTQTLQLADPFDSETTATSQPGQWQVQNPRLQKKRIKQRIKRELSLTDMMGPGEAARVKDVWALSKRDKWRLYRYWVDQMCTGYRYTVERYQKDFEEGAQRLREIKSLEDLSILKTATVIGMTTTGAAKYRNLIQKIKPRITVVEEAAEVLESHIVTSLSPGCQHLILIGDHQQLRPNPNVYTLAKDYKLDMSLFERMVHNGMMFERLRAQHRMRPEIARLMEPIYDDLENHESVLNCENIKGLDKNIFFIEHNEFEEYIEEGRSRSNIHEAKYLAALCRYFILQGYKRQQITILTMYTGQLIQIKKEMPKEFFRGVRICAVDNFQGEENDIILLSLVRSNEEENIGFLKTANRVCVALSRAKKGFYCIGNINLMCSQGKLWSDIISIMRDTGNVGPALTLTCQNHPRNVIQASSSDDFRKAPEGGCMEPCKARLECGHTCQMVCHPTDPQHIEYQCRNKCTKSLCGLGHTCKGLCFQECGPCTVRIDKLMPNCPHIQQVPCHKDPNEFACKGPCLKKLLCGHQCTNLCSEKCTEKCRVKVQKKWDCGHVNEVECHVDPKERDCAAPCGELLKCEHQCAGSCSTCFHGRLHQPCKAKCDRNLFCGHSCPSPCTKNCPPCQKKCENECVHSKCQNKCGERCIPCMTPCAWKCEHYKCKRLCGEPCDRPRCKHPCKKTLRKCGHPCIGMCGEPCPKKCRVCDKEEVTAILFGDEDEPNARFVELQACGHVIEVDALDNWMDNCENNSIQLKRCPWCKTPIRTNLRYGNIVKTMLNDFEEIKAKHFVPDYKITLESSRLKRLISQELSREFPEDTEKITKSIESKSLTNEQLNMFENQINFMNCLSKYVVLINKEVRTRIHHFTLAEILAQDEADSIKEEVTAIKSRVMELRMRYSDQELEEMNDEILRLQLVISYRILLIQKKRQRVPFSGEETARLDRILKVIESEKRIDEQTRERYMGRIEKIRKTHHLHYEPVTKEDKAMIVRAIGLTQGHWFKCPKGHIYCIGECGGAMEEATCPECKSRIGGMNHALRTDNALASEMDGASYAAWSETANNMANFDLEFV